MPYFDIDTLNDAEATLEDYLAIASDMVQKYAPTPDPLPDPDTYSPRAARAERLVLNYLSQTQGFIEGASLTGTGSVSFSENGMKNVKAIVRETMGSYYAAGGSYSIV